MMRYLLNLLLVALNINCLAHEKELDWLDHYVLAEQAIGIKDGKTAVEEFSKAIELNPDELILYVQRGQVYIKKHEQNIHCCVGCGGLLKNLSAHNRNPTDETNCKWCDRVGETADGICVTTFKSAYG